MAAIATQVQARLNAEYLETRPVLATVPDSASLPERVLQFGEGGFLRGFVDWMIHGMNRQGLFGGRVIVVQPIAHGQVSMLNEQDGAYTLLMRGVENGEVLERQEVITSISRGISPYMDFAAYLRCAHNPDLRFIVSNTTEAGIAFSSVDKFTDTPQASFPGKLTRFLYERFQAFAGDPQKGFVLLPCELIDRNGDKLKETVLKTAALWKLGHGFEEWVQTANVFTNTLVDRIVTGFPKDEIDELSAKAGYRDDLFDTSELFHLWVIEGPESIARELPLAEAGYNVMVTDSMKPYRDRKVGILNGAHTSTALAAYLAGFDYVGDAVADPIVSSFMRHAIYDEVIPTLTLPKQELELFAEAVFERFSNPFIKHALQSIALNSVSKYRARVLPSVECYVAAKGKLPARLTFALAALLAYYRGTQIENGALIGSRDGHPYKVMDNLPILETMVTLWSAFDGTAGAMQRVADGALSQADWWGKDLRTLAGLSAAVAEYLDIIASKGMRAGLVAADQRG